MVTTERRLDELEHAHGRLLIRFQDALSYIEVLKTRIDVLDHFIKSQYPEFFAGEAETKADPTLHPIPIIYGTPQEHAIEHGDGSVTWETTHKDGSVTREIIGNGDKK
jgi:hypothetical protein